MEIFASRTRVRALFFAAMMLGCASVQATVTHYTDEAAWSAAAGSTTVVDFNDVTLGVLSPGANSFNGFNVNLTQSGGSTLNLNRAFSPASGAFDTNHLILAVRSAGYSVTSFTFDSPVTAFAADWYSVASQSVIGLTVDGTLVNLGTQIGGIGTGFYGFVSDVAISAIAVSRLDTENFTQETFAIDNVQFAQVPMYGHGLLALFVIVGRLFLTRKSV